MKVFITGGTGFIGSTLTAAMASSGHTVTVLTRSIPKWRFLPECASYLEGNPAVPGHWQLEVAEHDVIINLAGTPIFGRWSANRKKDIFLSRMLTTEHIVEALSYRKDKETHFFSASGIGFYGPRGDETIDETGDPGDDFLAQVALRWESTALRAREFGARVVLCRFGNVLGIGGGVFPRIAAMNKRHLSNAWGSGQQWFSWIHEEDVAHIFMFLLKHQDIDGGVNFTAPHPIRNRELMDSLRLYSQKYSIIPKIPGHVFKLAFGESASMVLEGQRAASHVLPDRGYNFRYPLIEPALLDLLKASE